MKENKRHKHADVIIAWLNGEIIECRGGSLVNWEDVAPYVEGAGMPGFYEQYEYRVKPKTKTVWYNLYTTGPGSHYYNSEETAIHMKDGSMRTPVATLSVEIPA